MRKDHFSFAPSNILRVYNIMCCSPSPLPLSLTHTLSLSHILSHTHSLSVCLSVGVSLSHSLSLCLQFLSYPNAQTTIPLPLTLSKSISLLFSLHLPFLYPSSKFADIIFLSPASLRNIYLLLTLSVCMSICLSVCLSVCLSLFMCPYFLLHPNAPFFHILSLSISVALTLFVFLISLPLLSLPFKFSKTLSTLID